MRHAAAFAVLLILGAAAPADSPTHAQTTDVPAPLRGWEDWVLDGREYLRCPYSSAGANIPGGRVCAWPGPLVLDAGATGASFEQRLRVYAPGWVPLPDGVNAWPQDVRVDGRAAPVTERDGHPWLWLPEGTHEVDGRLYWSRMPDAIRVPDVVGLVRLRVNGVPVALPERSGESLRLGAAQREIQSNRLDVQVYRKLVDSVPGLLETRVQLNVAGEAREVLLGAMLPSGFEPLRLDGALPARLEPDGRLRVQVRPGVSVLTLKARAPSALTAVQLPESGVPEEVWSFEAVDRLRSAAVEDVPAIDPSQANVPADWQSLPAYRLTPGTTLRVVERSRGIGGEDLNRVEVQRDLWWDFDGDGLTFRDRVGGRMQQDWRLDMAAPWLLQGARQDEQPLLVTRGADGRAGVELRAPNLNLEAAGRIEKRGGRLPAAGWDTRLASLGILLQLPPGHRLLAAPGVDESSTAWLDRWRLLDIFVVLLVTTAAYRVAGVRAAALALAALALTHHEFPALTWAVLNLLIAIGLAQAAGGGRLRRWTDLWRALSLGAVIVILVPFAFLQARLAFFPQLEPGSGMPVPMEATVFEQGAPPVAPVTEAVSVTRPEPDVALDSSAAEGAGMLQVPRSDALDQRARLKSGRLLQRYAPGTLLQHGPGVPQWTYQQHPLRWGGPVDPAQTLRLVVLTPLWVSCWRLAGIVLLALLTYVLVRRVHPRAGWPALDRWLRLAPPATVLAVAVGLALPSSPPHAETPSPELLKELGQRLTRPPECAPDCAAVPQAWVRVTGGELEIRLEAHTQTLAALALPDASRWQPTQVLVDGEATSGLARLPDGTLAVALAAGVHTIVVTGALPPSDALRIAFRERPARVRIDAPGWQIGGIEDERLIADSLNLIRPVQPRVDGSAPAAREEFPPFVRVTRTLDFGLDWTVDTTVERLAPAQGAFSLRLPLLPGESVLTAGLPVRDGRVEIGLPAGVAHAGWQSSLERGDALVLESPVGVPYVEVWRLAVGPSWHLALEGTPEVFPAQDPGAAWIRQFEPRPGEKLAVSITRPAAVPGPTFAFERVVQSVTPGRRSTDTVLELDYRSTQGERHGITLPRGARLQSVTADGQTLTIRDQDGELALPLQPGAHQLRIGWQADIGTTLATRPGVVDLHAPATNVHTSVAMPASRWVLFAVGGGVGPAILYWAELAVFVALALLLVRLRRTPLAAHEWLLVGLGLSTFSWSVLLLFAAWVFAFDWRSRWQARVEPWAFNGIQVLLVLLTVAALGSLIAAIPNGLLGAPDMSIEGRGSHRGLLNWFHDRVDARLPQPVVVSVSIWFYKAAMLAWALWLSFALVRWVRWGWTAWTAGRAWYGTGRLVTAFRPAEPEPPPGDAGS